MRNSNGFINHRQISKVKITQAGKIYMTTLELIQIICKYVEGSPRRRGQSLEQVEEPVVTPRLRIHTSSFDYDPIQGSFKQVD
jgi:hypothetical protein